MHPTSSDSIEPALLDLCVQVLQMHFTFAPSCPFGKTFGTSMNQSIPCDKTPSETLGLAVSLANLSRNQMISRMNNAGLFSSILTTVS